MPSESHAPRQESNRGAEAHSVVVTKLSPWSMAETVARLSAVVAARGMKVYAVIDHGDEAKGLGVDLGDTRLFIVGSASISAPVIAAEPLAALALPLRVVVWEDGHRTKLSYPSPAEVARRFGLDSDLASALEGIDALTNAVVDR